MKLTPKEANVLIYILELDTCTETAENDWQETTCGIHGLTKNQADRLYKKLYKISAEVNQ
jgi:hypothetical protein